MTSLLHEPHKIKTVRRISFPSLETRKKVLSAVDFNVFHLTPSQLSFDMSSLGTSAVTQEQLCGQYIGDEAYAGARNFEALKSAVAEVLGFSYVCPTHSMLGSLNLISSTLLHRGAVLSSNCLGLKELMVPRGIELASIRGDDPLFTGNLDLARLARILDRGEVKVVSASTFADGRHAVSMENIAQAREICDTHGVQLLLDASRIIENAWYIQRYEPGQSTRSISNIVKELAKNAHICHVDGAQAPKANAGGFIATDNPRVYEKLMNEVVVYEGLHTYGGMAGRTMEVLARGLRQMVDEEEVHWVMYQTEVFSQRLREAGVPHFGGCDGVYLKASEWLPEHGPNKKDALSAALYQVAGLRAQAHGLTNRDDLVPVQIPRLAMTNDQLEQVADAVILTWKQRKRIPRLESLGEVQWRDQRRYRWVFADLETYEFDCMPYLVHTIERVPVLSREQRLNAIREAGYNTFLLRSDDVTIDFLTDSGTSAMSTDQWAAYEAAVPTPCACDTYEDFCRELFEIYGYKYLIPTHQGRAAEHILSQVLIKDGQLVPGNMYFTTTKLHQELAGGVFRDVICDEAHRAQSDFPWKGNIDLKKLAALVDEHGADKIAYVSFELSVNMAGGQPASMDNLRDVYGYCSARGIPVMFDATRMAENAYMIKSRDPRYARTPVKDIMREMANYGDGCTVSGKKDFLTNVGGLLAFRDHEDWAREAEGMLRIWEGSVRSGGLSSADLAAIAQGVQEMSDDQYIRARVEQTRQLGQLLTERGIPIVTPAGSHAIFLDARRFLPHIDQDEFPAQRLAAEIYVETGVRAMERGNVSKGRDPETGKNHRPALELVRLTIPRRVYSRDHMEAVADGIAEVYGRRQRIAGLRFTYEPQKLRFFQSRFEPLEEVNAGGPPLRRSPSGIRAFPFTSRP